MNKRVILNLCKGALIGVGAILPGISGGVLCVALGIYGLVMTFLAHPLTEFRRRWQELVPLLVGFGVACWGCPGWWICFSAPPRSRRCGCSSA